MVGGSEGDIQVSGRESIIRVREGAERVRQELVEVKVFHNQMRVIEQGKNMVGSYGAVWGTVCVEEVYRGNSEGAVGGPKWSFRRKNMYGKYFRGVVKDSGA